MGNLASTVGKGVAVGAGALAAGFTAATKQAFDLYGPLEQNLGGVEAVFGEYAWHVQELAEKAALNMGASMSDYLAAVNQMGSLAQGAGFSASESVFLVTDAMQRAADVASVMGLSSERAMESIAGLFKGNFTMMDNLGVAINDAAIAEYALAQGIEKSTQEMTTQEKVGLALQLFMSRTAKYAGNYRKENETLSGSFEVLHAAWDNFLVGTEDSAEILVESLFNAGTAAFTAIKDITPRLWNNFSEAAELALPRIKHGWDVLWNDTLPSLAVNGADFIIDGVNSVFGTNIPRISSIDFPTWEEIESKVSTWWSGSGDSVYEKLKNTLSWAMGKLDLPSTTETVETVKNWWEKVALPPITKVTQWTFGELVLPAWVDLVDNVTTWWSDDISPQLEALTEWFTNPQFPSWESLSAEASNWWEGVRAGLESMAKFYATYDIKRVYSDEELNAASDWSIDTTAGATTPVFTPEANGLAYVPFDGYRAELHYGEAVLPRQAAEEYRAGLAGGGADTAALLSEIRALGDRIERMSINMDGKRVGDLVTERVSRNIAKTARQMRSTTI